MSIDSKILYIKANLLKNKIAWNYVSKDSEWVYFGESAEQDSDLVFKTIREYFKTKNIYIILGRNDSYQIKNNNNEIETLNKYIGTVDFFMWNDDFDKAIEFNKIGALRIGSLDNNM